MLTNSTDIILHGNGSLVLHNVGAEDSGNYACIAENGDLSIMTDAQVNVNSKFYICFIRNHYFLGFIWNLLLSVSLKFSIK